MSCAVAEASRAGDAVDVRSMTSSDGFEVCFGVLRLALLRLERRGGIYKWNIKKIIRFKSGTHLYTCASFLTRELVAISTQHSEKEEVSD